jgi:hypothetical protein
MNMLVALISLRILENSDDCARSNESESEDPHGGRDCAQFNDSDSEN